MIFKHFIKFSSPIKDIELPKKFTFPFYYEPHPLAKIAAEEVQGYLENQSDFKHNFGLSDKETSLAIGKMFGVLVVKNQQNEIGYLASFSGKLADNSFPEKFVPPVFNMRSNGSFYLEGEEEINQINKRLSQIKKDETYLYLKKSLKTLSKKIDDDLTLEREKLKFKKKIEKLERKLEFQP
ncbi:hypothetical protein [Polaribacter sp. Hel1_85]|uniref:hypothetical protein n=1 Tax=Polaribacter sp. Hel1_85 TaxID=1250005 RepID=UPI000B2A071F|nr:hypothetical protein [Polaribacter sp. Hel1_85]